MNCKKCCKALRPRKTKIADHPGTVELYGQGYCKRCWKIVEPVRERVFRPRDCEKCERPMRPKDAKIADHPGTVPHRAFGKCQTCYHADAIKSEPAEVVDPPVEITDPGVLKLMRDRRARQAKQEQMRRVMVEAEARRREFIASRRAA